MTITSKFNIGDIAFTIDRTTLKVMQFTVGRITALITDDSVIISLYAEDDQYLQKLIPEGLCFHSVKELLQHIASDTPEAE